MTSVKNYFSLVKFSHTIFALPFALIGFSIGVHTSYFSKNEDLNKLKSIPMYKSLAEVKAGSDVLEVRFPESSKPVRFRNYLYGRSTAWSTAPEAYGRLFPNIKKTQDIADAMRILNETRGSRLLAGGLTMFVR